MEWGVSFLSSVTWRLVSVRRFVLCSRVMALTLVSSERAQRMKQMGSCFLAVVCVCNQCQRFKELSSMALLPLLGYYLPFVLSSWLQGCVALAVCVREHFSTALLVVLPFLQRISTVFRRLDRLMFCDAGERFGPNL